MPRPLPATAWAVLGILSFDRELSGYQVKRWADASLTFFYWSPAISQVYGELKRLEELGYVAGRDVAEEQRTIRVYRITDEGRTALTGWLEDAPVEPPVLKHGVLLRLWLGHLSTPDRLRQVVEQHRAQTERVLAELTSSERKAEQEPDWEFPALVLRWGERYYRNELEQTAELLRELDALEG
ncbi:MAG: PadR family transcriptional regulator [Actinomycetia bacterium]|nr:PadR family transcriptional regulator [Actinomycetes bacterium]